MVSLIVFERSGGGKKNLAHESDSVRTVWRWVKKQNKKNLSGETGGLCTTNVKESLLRGLVATSFVIFLVHTKKIIDKYKLYARKNKKTLL